MRIKRANFRFNRLVNVDDIIGHSNLLYRIVVTNGYNERFRGRIVEVANDIANRICGLYNTFMLYNKCSHI